MRQVKSLQDATIVIKELAQWKDRISSKNQNFNGLKIQNAGNATEPQDYVTLSQLTSAVNNVSTPNQNYSIPWSTNTVNIGMVFPPYIVGQDRVGNPTSVSVAVPTSTQAPTYAPLSFNIQLNGVNMLINDLTLPENQEGPVSTSAFVTPLPKLTVGAKLVPTISSAGGASYLTIQLYIVRA